MSDENKENQLVTEAAKQFGVSAGEMFSEAHLAAKGTVWLIHKAYSRWRYSSKVSAEATKAATQMLTAYREEMVKRHLEDLKDTSKYFAGERAVSEAEFIEEKQKLFDVAIQRVHENFHNNDKNIIELCEDCLLSIAEFQVNFSKKTEDPRYSDEIKESLRKDYKFVLDKLKENFTDRLAVYFEREKRDNSKLIKKLMDNRAGIAFGDKK